MFRRGVSCATAMDFLTVLYQTVVAGKDPLSELDKIPTERQLRDEVSKVRLEFMDNIGQLHFDGKIYILTLPFL